MAHVKNFTLTLDNRCPYFPYLAFLLVQKPTSKVLMSLALEKTCKILFNAKPYQSDQPQGL